MVRLLESHARRIYALANNPSLTAALALSHKFQDPEVSLGDWPEKGFTAYEIERRHWTGVNLPSLINSALARLEEIYWIRVKEIIRDQLVPVSRYEAVPHLRDEHQVLLFVNAHEQRIEPARTGNVATDHELLLHVRTALDPGA